MSKPENFEKKMLKRLDDIESRLGRVEKSVLEIERYSIKPKKWLKFAECIPPTTVCKDVCSMMIGVNCYTGFLARLREYYNCEPMGMFVDVNKCPEKYAAMYYHDEKAAYTRGSVYKPTVLHEWFHHLVNLKVVFLNDSEQKKSEKLADEYAATFLKRAGVTE